MSKLQLLLLGHFECLLPSGERISLSMRKAEMLLAFLALAPGIRHPRERLINLLWGDRGEEQARNSLRQCLSAIKKSLGDVADLVMQVDRTSVSLKPEMIDIDALEFERLATIAEFESLSDAAALYRGEFLEGISIRDAASQEWLDSERSRFKRQYIEILTNLGHTLLASHDYNGAIRTTEHLVAEDALGESGWRLLMRAYSANDDRSHALQAFKRCQQALRSELEVEPEAATLELRDQIAASQVQPAQAPVGDIAATVETSAPPATDNGETPADATPTSDHSIAVLPFDNLSGDPEQEYFSDGITDSIILNLALFPDLQVKSRNSSFAFKEQIKSVGEISAELDVDYLVEGSIRKSSDRIRITVQLIEAASGTQVWGKRYDADLENLFDLEEELSRSIAATVTGQIESDLQRIALTKGAADQQSYDLLLAGIYHANRSNREDIAIAIDKLDSCLALDPGNLRAHATIYQCHIMNWMDRLVEDYPASFELASKHARLTLELDPETGEAQYTYGEYLMFCHRHEQAGPYLDRAVAINPNNPTYLTAKAMHHSMQGNFEAAIDLAVRACQLDPYNWWVDWNLAEAHYLCGHYQQTIDTLARSKNAPGFIRIYGVAANVKLEHLDVARQSLQEYLQACRESMRAMPQTLDDWLQYTVDTAPFADPEINQGIVDCLVQAGLCDEVTEAHGDTPSIAVLPFENMGGDPEQSFFSDGITADIISTLSRFRNLRIVARHSTEIYRNRKAPIAEIAQQQNVRYILEGSVRRSGKRIRVSAELIDAQSEQNCWSEHYDRDLDDLFKVQDEITKEITLAMKVHLDDGEMAQHRSAGATSIKAWELTITAIDLQETYIRQDILEARSMAKKALQLDPRYSYAGITLAWTYWQEVYSGWSESLDETLGEAEKITQGVLEVNPDYADALCQAGINYLMRHDANKAVEYCRRAVDLEPGNAEIQALMAFACVFSGDYEQARIHNQNLHKLCPVKPGWYYLMGGLLEQYDGDLDKAIAIFQQGLAVEPDSPLCRFYLVHALMQNGDRTGAQKLAHEIRALDASANGSGLVRTVSIDATLRDAFHSDLEEFGLV
ncbi:MAG: tetratricopeptide repeat protein [Gammaproteobacteria bacterium]|nr:tetratricopeptide repeat protein [Gammaproteobacteria bacterium]